VSDADEPELAAAVKALSDAQYGWSDGLVVELTSAQASALCARRGNQGFAHVIPKHLGAAAGGEDYGLRCLSRPAKMSVLISRPTV